MLRHQYNYCKVQSYKNNVCISINVCYGNGAGPAPQGGVWGPRPLVTTLAPLSESENYEIQWKPVKVTPLKVNNRLRSTVDVSPVFYALYISNLNPDNVNHLRPQSCYHQHLEQF